MQFFSLISEIIGLGLKCNQKEPGTNSTLSDSTRCKETTRRLGKPLNTVPSLQKGSGKEEFQKWMFKKKKKQPKWAPPPTSQTSACHTSSVPLEKTGASTPVLHFTEWEHDAVEPAVTFLVSTCSKSSSCSKCLSRLHSLILASKWYHCSAFQIPTFAKITSFGTSNPTTVRFAQLSCMLCRRESTCLLTHYRHNFRVL